MYDVAMVLIVSILVVSLLTVFAKDASSKRREFIRKQNRA